MSHVTKQLLPVNYIPVIGPPDSLTLTGVSGPAYYQITDNTEMLHRRSAFYLMIKYSESAKIRKLISKGNGLIGSEPAKAGEAASKAVKLARLNGSIEELSDALILLSRVLMITERLNDGLEASREAVSLVSELRETCTLARALNNTGNCLRKCREPAEAMTSYKSALEIYRANGHAEGISSVLSSMGSTYAVLGLYDDAYNSFWEAIDAASSPELDLYRASAMKNLAGLPSSHLKPHDAESFLQKSLRINRRNKKQTGVAQCLDDLGRLSAAVDNFKKAESYTKEAIGIWRKLESSRSLIYSLFFLGELLESQNRLEEAVTIREEVVLVAEKTGVAKFTAVARSQLATIRMRLGQTDGIEEILKDLIDVLDETAEDIQEKAKAYGILTSLYEKQNKLNEALAALREKTRLDALLMTMEKENDIDRMKLRADYQRSEDARIILQEQKRKLEDANIKLREALDRIKTLSGMLPICSHCKKIRNDEGYWEQIEHYITVHSEADFSHSVCPACLKEHYPPLSES